MVFEFTRAWVYSSVAFSAISMAALTPKVGYASDIIYNGTEEQYNQLQNDPILSSWKSVRPSADQGSSGNTITITGPSSPADTYYAPFSVYGGFDAFSSSGIMTDNSVNMSGGNVGYSIYGAYGSGIEASNISITENSVHVSNGSIGHSVYGGFANDESHDLLTLNVAKNTVRIDSGIVTRDIHGGSANSDGNGTAVLSVIENSVFLSGDVRANAVFGGSGFSSINGSGSIITNVIGNMATVSGGTIQSAVYGGFGTTTGQTLSPDSGDVTMSINNNKTIVSGGASVGAVLGGSALVFGAADGSVFVDVIGNSTDVSSGSVTSGEVYGGVASGSGYGEDDDNIIANVRDNSLVISQATVALSVYGGSANFSGFDDGNVDLVVSDNSVFISESIINKDVYGGHGIGNSYDDGHINLNVTDNRLVIDNSNIVSSVHGGYGYGDGTDDGDNIVTVTGNSVSSTGTNIGGSVYGGYGDGYGYGYGYDDGDVTVSVKGNSVVATGSDIGGSVYGGYATGYGYDDGVVIVKSYENSVVISGGVIQGSVYGSYVEAGGYGEASSSNNSVTIKNGSVINGGVYGSYVKFNNDVIDDFSSVIAGNTLNIDLYSGSVSGVYNFENYNWLLSKTVSNGDTIITITGDDAVDLTQTAHAIARENDGKRLNVGDEIVLMSKANGEPDKIPSQVPDHIEQGHFILYDVDVKLENEQFVLRITGDDGEGEEAGRSNPKSKSFVEGRAASLAFVSQGSELIATAGIDNIRLMSGATENEATHRPLIPFMIMQGASNRYKTGSHVDINGFNMATGLASGLETEQGSKLTLGGFFEYGRGSYLTYSSYADYGSVRGSGDIDYTGGGIFGRVDFAGTGLNRVTNLPPMQVDGLYLEASLRAGSTSTNFDSDDLVDAEGYRGSYDSKSSYIGGHASAGYVLNLDERHGLDVHARYLWTLLGSDTVTVGIDRLHFDKSTSSRMQLGGRYSSSYNDKFKTYLGATYEYEFAGDVGASAYGLRLDEPSLEGSTGIIDVGFSYMPIAKSPGVSLNVNAQGFIGQRQGGAGQVKFKYQF